MSDDAYGMLAAPDFYGPLETPEQIRARVQRERGGRLPQGLANPTTLAGRNRGLRAPGNLDLGARPNVRNPDGSWSSVRSLSFNQDGHEVLIPTVSEDGRVLSDDDAIANYDKTGGFLGKFDTPAHATSYAQRLHEQQAAAGPSPDGAAAFVTQEQAARDQYSKAKMIAQALGARGLSR